jgi:hypothetical protein
MKTARVGIIGQPFPGMGDFAIPFADLKKYRYGGDSGNCGEIQGYTTCVC